MAPRMKRRFPLPMGPPIGDGAPFPRFPTASGETA